MATVADQFIRVLRQAGVRRIYGVVGDSLNPVVDAVRRTGGDIEWVHVRNEEAGAFAAAAEAQTTPAASAGCSTWPAATCATSPAPETARPRPSRRGGMGV
ncbi:thiamine pyrophosphate-binding protein [Actinomadura physcomitrii]|uniref:thiamine pyrophosphate-binding protein n=1 Tax=Actinomadura physcomitrii TaxID=2650748 RepID=UPI0022A77665|nr:thiamine pyrophosphate-binding protein [Actinomadura physcomitrii]